jgi:putative peptide-modifying radical SAM enzyme
MHYHIILTEECNSHCRYCCEKSFGEFDNGLEKKFKFDFSCACDREINLKKLKDFISEDREAVIIFYGGEPLLKIALIEKIMDAINVPYRIQTNGKLLNQLPPSYLNRIGKILVSLDGGEKRTDFNRGKDTFKTVVKNIEHIKKNGYTGEIIARMTIGQEFPDIYRQVRFLYKKGFRSIHWQIDAGFYKFDFDQKKIEKFFKEYNQNVAELLEFWIGELEAGNLLKFYPFLGIAESLIKGEKVKMRCGAGHSGYTITPDGKIVACPIMNCIEDFKAGDLSVSPDSLKKFDCSEECSGCGYYSICGGRCLYWRKASLWPKKGNEMICSSIKFLIDKLKAFLPRIQKAIETDKVHLEEFNYEKYFGPEIIP